MDNIKLYNNVPLYFELNKGQADEEIKFLARGKGCNIYLMKDEVVFVIKKGLNTENSVHKKDSVQYESKLLKMKFALPADNVKIEGVHKQQYKVNYFIGNNPENWHTETPTYSKVKYNNILPGVDVVYYGNGKQLEYDIIVSPGANPEEISMDFEGLDSINEDSEGNLILKIDEEEIKILKPKTYQKIKNKEQMVNCNYTIKDNAVGFKLGDYAKNNALVIDPIILAYSTYLGGSSIENGYSIAVDNQGNAYVAGGTESLDFPGTENNPLPGVNSFQPKFAGVRDAFVTKINAKGTELIYSSYLGGSRYDYALAIALDNAGYAYITGYTESDDFPGTGTRPIQGVNCFQPNHSIGVDAFVAKINPQGNGLVYSSYLGGSSADIGYGIAVDIQGNAYVTGSTSSTNFPGTRNNPIPGVASFQPDYGYSNDAFVSKINNIGTTLIYSSYLGGSSYDVGLCVVVDSEGSAYVTGAANSTDFPGTNGYFQPFNGGDNDAFVVKVKPDGTALIYSTYLGGAGREFGSAVAIDDQRNAYIAGYTSSTNFPGTRNNTIAGVNSFQPDYGGNFDAFVTKINSQGKSLIYSSYLGGSGSDIGYAIALDNSYNIYITGFTQSSDFPGSKNGFGVFQPDYTGTQDGFVTKINSSGTAIMYSSYLGGNGSDEGRGIALDSQGNIYIAGSTESTNFPGTKLSSIRSDASFQDSIKGATDTFVIKIAQATTLIVEKKVVNNSSVYPGDIVTFLITVKNTGLIPATNVDFSDAPNPNDGIEIINTSHGTISFDKKMVAGSLGTINSNASVTITITCKIL